MAKLADLSLPHRLFMRRYAFQRYRGELRPAEPLRIPLAEATVALVTTGGLHLPEQPPFDTKARGGDDSYRVIPRDRDPSTLLCAHRSDAFDHSGVIEDPQVAFPQDALRALVAAGEVGKEAPEHLSFMGSITKPEHLIAKTAPEAARRIASAGVDAALLVPL